ncbi:unnamed protein product, partial [marine sediment metagenome]
FGCFGHGVSPGSECRRMGDIALRDQELTVTTLEHMLGTPAIPDRWESVPDALAAIFTGREMGIGPMMSLSQLYIVDGQVALEGKTMLALIYKAGHKVQVNLTTTKATVVAYRWDPKAFESSGAYYEAGIFNFTMDDAIAAGLWEKDNYQQYPADMLGWKAVARAARFAYPDVLLGGYVPEDVGIETPVEQFEQSDDVVIEDEPTEAEATENLEDILDATVTTGMVETGDEPDVVS